MSNLLKETIEKLKDNGKDESNVLWVGDDKYKTTWENFKQIANVEYDSGFGGQEIASDLIIMGDTFWLERHEYDGSEWWEYKSKDMFNPTETRRMKSVLENRWHSSGDGSKWDKPNE